MQKTKPSNVVLVRRHIGKVIDDVAEKIEGQKSNRNRTYIAVFGSILAALYTPLSELQTLQQSGQRELPDELKEEILATEKVFASAMLKDDFKTLKEML